MGAGYFCWRVHWQRCPLLVYSYFNQTCTRQDKTRHSSCSHTGKEKNKYRFWIYSSPGEDPNRAWWEPQETRQRLPLVMTWHRAPPTKSPGPEKSNPWSREMCNVTNCPSFPMGEKSHRYMVVAHGRTINHKRDELN